MLLTAAASASTASAAISYEIAGTFNGTTFGGISIGDSFEITLTINETVVDTENSNREALFGGAVTQFDFDLENGAFTYTSSGVENIQGDDDPFFDFDSVTFFAPGSFPELGGFQIENIFLDFEVPHNPGAPVNDTGLGQTYSSMVTSLTNASAWDNYADADFVIRGPFGLSMSGDVTSVQQPVPEPAALSGLFGLAALGLARRRS